MAEDGSGGTDMRVKMAHINIKQCSITRSNKCVALELQYRTKASMCNVISFQDWPQEISRMTQEKGKVSGEELNQKMRIFSSDFISKSAVGQVPIVSTAVGL